MNKTFLIGHAGQDPETVTTTGGTVICKFSLATSEKIKGESKTEWHRIVAFGKTAEICQQYLSKGKQVCVVGKIQYRQWEKDGVTRYMTEIVTNEIELLGGKGEGRQQAPAPARQENTTTPDNDIPF